MNFIDRGIRPSWPGSLFFGPSIVYVLPVGITKYIEFLLAPNYSVMRQLLQLDQEFVPENILFHIANQAVEM